MFRSLKREEALKEFNSFKEIVNDFQDSVFEIENLLKDSLQNKKIDKVIFAMKEIVEKTTQRKIKSKIPIVDINYLEAREIKKSDIDWILKKWRTFGSNFYRFMALCELTLY